MKNAALLSLLLVATACGNSKPSVQNGNDMSTTTITGDMAMAMNVLHDMAGGPSTPPLVAGTGQLLGVSDDDRAIFSDNSAGVKAVPLAGGAAVTIDAMSDDALLINKVVFSWANIDSNTGLGDLTVYSVAGGVKSLGSNSVDEAVAADPSGAYILYTLNGNAADGSSADLYFAKSDGTGAKMLYAQVETDGNCGPNAVWANGNFIISHCDGTAMTDAGTSVASLSILAAATGKVTEVPGAYNNVVDVDTGGTVITTTTAGDDGLVVIPLAVPVAVPLETGVAAPFVSPDGKTLLYRTDAGALVRLAIPAAGAKPAPVTLVASSVNTIQAISSDFKWVVYSNRVDTNTNLTDLYLASATTPGTPVTLDSSTDGAIYGDAFTADVSHVLFFNQITSPDPNNPANTVGAFNTMAVSGGAATVQAMNAYLDLATTGTKVTFNDNYMAVQNLAGRADIKAVDSASGMPTLIAASADANYSLSFEKDRVVYSLSAPAGSEGVYVLPLK